MIEIITRWFDDPVHAIAAFWVIGIIIAYQLVKPRRY